MKVLCEQEAERQFPGCTLILRPGCIVGPGDFNRAFAYWPMRLERGGEVLIAGDPSQIVQFIDVRDLADWTVRLIENGATGVYNVVGPKKDFRLGELVDAAAASVSASAKLTWVPSLVVAQAAHPLMPLLLWSTDRPGPTTNMRLNADHAFAAGLTVRSVEITLRDTVDWYRRQSIDGVVVGGSAKEGEAGWDLATVPWPTYLEWEKEVLSARHGLGSSMVRGSGHE